MAKKKSSGVNKSQAIREYCAANPEAKPLEVAEAMKAIGIDVNAQFVSTVKSNSKKSKKTGRRGRPAGVSAKKAAPAKKLGRPAASKARSNSGEVSLDSLINAKKLVEEMGGVDNARNAISVLEQLMD
ncbi:hypothetical protein [Allorhodopirellula heiligendammensis]|uniref:Uncharacterized protein n=1 Tax=Allorhodopirellula heiligendammensis TaxID=2714739 RepID=A0A5C6BGU4_9BACT|nr:hypothetical protein [Allorhodopirellula heiligendammensis]TWU10711.1 hypothetical protein Poly21_46170 [Allorhodopirellula heiligendammensis]|tara:strand:+ start:2361 stop:2744 length:384 start_codon:yes stop_codon:yes gene_type:complete